MTVYNFTAGHTGDNGDPLDTNYFEVETAGAAIAVDIQSNSISIRKTGTAASCARIILRDGAGSYLSLENAELRMDVQYVAAAAGESSLPINLRQQNSSGFRTDSAQWYAYAQTANGYSLWGWEYGSGSLFLQSVTSGTGADLDSWTSNPAPSNTYTYVVGINGTSLYARRFIGADPETNNAEATDSDWASGFLSFGFGDNSDADAEIRISNLTVDDLASSASVGRGLLLLGVGS